ncbi:uncharacterized vacuolar membrane protein YML018C-like [Andrographis paniculata]|uniref:uncharacterized vacuolar membrane protein YML018C-like n=1 Tax=Andrographis paniculata TaxID=175694 RepID=UPI0021E78BE6|nr:uncharacterized vacuolar membrane protein YML018C-like [Andrographis paniculata]XP_051142346.1 uncharacterized vacuolar membrane protein YML018C-like [Andrographis paniculata]
MKSNAWKWILGLIYIFAVAVIWIAASFVVQSVVDAGVSPFLVTYICSALFVVYIPLVEIGRYLEDNHGGLLFWKSRNREVTGLQKTGDMERAVLLENDKNVALANGLDLNPDAPAQKDNVDHLEKDAILVQNRVPEGFYSKELDPKGRWTRRRVAKASLSICPFYFLAQLAFNVSLKYTTVTSNTILSSSSSLFSFLVALIFLGEKFTWLKLISVLLCMGGTVVVSLGDSEAGTTAVASNPVLGNILAVLSSAFYAIYVTLLRRKLPDEDDSVQGHVSMAQFLGFLGLFNVLLFLPVAVVINFAKIEPFSTVNRKQISLIVGKGLFDNVLSDFLWAKAVLLTTTTVATAGLSIQVPLAAIVDTLKGNAPNLMDCIGGAAILLGFTGINIPTDDHFTNEGADIELESVNLDRDDRHDLSDIAR